MSDIESQITISREERARLKAEDPSPSPRVLERMGRIGYCIYATVAVVLVCVFLGIYFGTSTPVYTSTVGVTVFVSNAINMPAALANGVRCDLAMATGVPVSSIKIVSWTMQAGNVTTLSAADSTTINSAALACPSTFTTISPSSVGAGLGTIANAKAFTINIATDDWNAPNVQSALQTKQTANLVLPAWTTNFWNATTQVLAIENAAQVNATTTYYPVITRMATTNFLSVLQAATVVTAPAVQNAAQL